MAARASGGQHARSHPSAGAVAHDGGGGGAAGGDGGVGGGDASQLHGSAGEEGEVAGADRATEGEANRVQRAKGLAEGPGGAPQVGRADERARRASLESTGDGGAAVSFPSRSAEGDGVPDGGSAEIASTSVTPRAADPRHTHHRAADPPPPPSAAAAASAARSSQQSPIFSRRRAAASPAA